MPALLLAGAFVSEYGFGLFPCEMCWWQRWPHFIALGLGLMATLLVRPKALIALAALAIALSGAIGVFHAGVEYDWWEGITGCARIEGSGGNALDEILAAPIVRCDAAAFRFLTISMAGWNAIISLGSALLIWGFLGKERAL